MHKSKRATLLDFIHWLETSVTLLDHSLREREFLIKTNNLEHQIESWLAFKGGAVMEAVQNLMMLDNEARNV